MTVLTTLFPVFFMLLLGLVSHIKGWVTVNQKNGANSIIFKILFPVLVFNLMANANIELSHISIILYVYIAYLVILVIGKFITQHITKKYQKFDPYLLTVVEGGNVALPLYLSIVGQSSTTVIFDLGGIMICFITIPILIAKEVSAGSSYKDIIKSIFTNTFVIAVILGLFMNFTGLYELLLASSFGDMISTTINQVTAPIIPMILFILGYDLNIDSHNLKPVLRLIAVKFVYYAFVILGFFVLFPELMADKSF
ncbi:MAG: AEC family transporter, partial [Thomasclavelia sp.]|uniref:AEC family transporter n=1 Tax=Thomasclavelia sp. TaxID=3025757 RepID=UPI0039A0CE2C